MSLSPQPAKFPGITTIIGVMSGKGGVGKSFVASALAITLAKGGKRVGLLDADICSPDMFKMLGIKNKIVPTVENKIVPVEKYGIKIVSMAGLCTSDDEPVAWRGPILSKIIQKLLKESLWGELDMLIIDFPTATPDITLNIMQQVAVDGVILVTTPQDLCVVATRRTATMATMLKVPLIGVVENMRGEIFGEGGGGRLAETFGIPLLGSIPLRKQIITLNDEGASPLLSMQELEIVFGKIARLMVERVFA